MQKIDSPRPLNGWAGWPASNLVVPQLKLQLIVAGDPHPQTGYLCNIKIVDQLLRQIVTRRLIPAYDGSQTAEQLLRIVSRELDAGWPDAVAAPDAHVADPPPEMQSITLCLSPWLRYSISKSDPVNKESGMSTADHVIELTQQFEFSAAHRLHCAQLSDQRNQELFGKCNNPEGHGHNYVVEVSVAAPVDSDRGQVIALHELESIVNRCVIDRLDHKHLNRDVEYFADVNPSVENIATVILQWLDGQFGSARLTRVKVFETPKTWAEATAD